MVHPHPFIGTTLLVLLGLFVSPAAQGETKKPTVTDVLNAWNARQKRIVSAKFEWEQQSFWPRHSDSFNYIEDRQLKMMRWPSADLTYAFPYRLELSGMMLRTECRNLVTAQKIRERLPAWSVRVSDGEVSKTFTHGDDSGQRRFNPFGSIGKTAEHHEAHPEPCGHLSVVPTVWHPPRRQLGPDQVQDRRVADAR